MGNAGGPKQADDLSVALGAESDEERGGILPKIAGSALHFPFLIQGPGVNFNFGADRAFVVVESFQIDVHPTVLIAAFIAKEDRGAA